MLLVVAGILIAVVGALAAPAAPAGAATDGSTRLGGIDVVQVAGLLDPPNVSLIRDTIRDANKRGATLVVLQIDSGGSVDIDLGPVLNQIDRSDVPVAAWVGPSGASGAGAAAVIVAASHASAVSPGSSIGPASPVSLSHPGSPNQAATRAVLIGLADQRGRSPEGAALVNRQRLGSKAAQEAGAVDGTAPTLGEFIVSLDGTTVSTAAGDVVLSTAKVVGEGQDRRRQFNQEVRFHKLTLGSQLVHTLTSPSIAYLLLIAGFALIIFEFFTAGIGLAGGTGALAVIGAFIGFSHLPVAWWGIALLAVAVIGFAIDVQAGGVATWSALGLVAAVVGSLGLYDGSSRLNLPWWVLLLVLVGLVLFMVGAMPAVVRSRYSTPTMGREGIIGEMGVAEADVAPEGVVVVRGARWHALTNRATPITAGANIRVVSVQGTVLEVEPEEGGARDYRDRARDRGRDRAAGRTSRKSS